MFERSFRGALNWSSMMPRDAGLSGGSTPVEIARTVKRMIGCGEKINYPKPDKSISIVTAILANSNIPTW